MGDPPLVILVDNNIADVEAMRQAFIEYWPGADLRIAWDGREGLHILRPETDQPMADLVILDLHLAEVHGRDLLAMLKADPATHQIPVVILTSTDDPLERQACLNAGAAEFITKPRTFRAFSPMLEGFRRLLGGTAQLPR